MATQQRSDGKQSHGTRSGVHTLASTMPPVPALKSAAHDRNLQPSVSAGKSAAGIGTVVRSSAQQSQSGPAKSAKTMTGSAPPLLTKVKTESDLHPVMASALHPSVETTGARASCRKEQGLHETRGPAQSQPASASSEQQPSGGGGGRRRGGRGKARQRETADQTPDERLHGLVLDRAQASR